MRPERVLKDSAVTEDAVLGGRLRLLGRDLVDDRRRRQRSFFRSGEKRSGQQCRKGQASHEGSSEASPKGSVHAHEAPFAIPVP